MRTPRCCLAAALPQNGSFPGGNPPCCWPCCRALASPGTLVAKPERHNADPRPHRAEARREEGSGRCCGPLLCRSCGRSGRFSSSLCTALSNRHWGRKRLRGAAVRTGSGWGAAGPGPGPLPSRLSAAPPAGPRQQRTPQAARPQSTDKRLVFPLLSFPPALTGEGPAVASREAGGPAEKLGEGAASDQDALASVSLGPCHLPGRSRVPAARRVLCPEPRVYGVLLCAPREKITPLNEIKSCPRPPGPPGGLAAAPRLP